MLVSDSGIIDESACTSVRVSLIDLCDLESLLEASKNPTKTG
jgi:hypothetical protein